MAIVRGFAIALLAIGISVLLLRPQSNRLPMTGVAELASQAEGALLVPPDEVKTVFDHARDIMFERNHRATQLKEAADLSTWASFICSALIAIVLGWTGKQVTLNAPIADEKLVGLPPKWAGIIGALAALATVSTVGGSQAQAQAEARFNAVTQLNTQISETQRALQTLDPIRQREALDQLKLLSERL